MLITVLLKPGKDAANCSSYRPICLLNVDMKILSKVLAVKINTVITNIISTDQTGLVRGRHSFINIRRLLNVHCPATGDAPEVVVSLDAERTFDRIEWGYLFCVLAKLGLDQCLCPGLDCRPERCIEYTRCIPVITANNTYFFNFACIEYLVIFMFVVVCSALQRPCLCQGY